MKKFRELQPDDNHKSFYGKAIIETDTDTGAETLLSYGTAILTRTESGELIRHWDGWSATTGRHIRAFCGLNKAGFFKIPLAVKKTADTGGRWMTPAESYRAMIGRRLAG